MEFRAGLQISFSLGDAIHSFVSIFILIFIFVVEKCELLLDVLSPRAITGFRDVLLLISFVQEAFSSIPSTLYYPPEQSGPEDFIEKDFPALSIFGDPVDSFTFTMPSRDRTAEFRTTCKSLQVSILCIS